ncbi:hypothetical protein [Megalodesulfovibrio gigas]|uniref:SGNH hydrolase-type esterase domain-containing protein n=1 Tax=Megalodesulfovibrio gigas (strain ATCC 19364 / DSM 1382 / NCIMB 9332 / VKM B-1759) TaxID=1121448 RepID=T2G9X0_MEGG1|nr:hypothetical protein [Megalodesulfovibrio gigas]AGW12702.1 hypothetical protein DGI_0807 [Megalodesulfovibrio gigas DSM 1382 = ATCC 19364]
MKTLRQAVLVLLLVFGAAELAAWLFSLVNEDRFLQADIAAFVPSQERIDLERAVFHPELGWKRRFPTRLGQRPQAVLPDRILLATYGDSFTYCDEVLGFETWQTHLAGLLGGGVLNFGNGAYGPDQAYLRFLEDQPAAGAPVAVLSLIGENIARVVNVYRRFYLPQEGNALTKPRFRLEQGALVLEPNPTPTQASRQRLREVEFLRDIGQRDYWFLRRTRQAAAFPYSSIFFNINQLQEVLNNVQWMRVWDEPGPRTLLLTLLDAFARDARAMGAQPVIGILPMELDMLHMVQRGAPPAYVETIAAHCRAAGIPCFDAVSALGATCKDAAAVRDLYLTTHCSPLGNERLALAWYEFLRTTVPERFGHLPAGEAALRSSALAGQTQAVLPRLRGVEPLRPRETASPGTASPGATLANATALAAWFVTLGDGEAAPPEPLQFAAAWLQEGRQAAAELVKSLLLAPALQARSDMTDARFIALAARTLWGAPPPAAEAARLEALLADRVATRADVVYSLLWDARFRDHCAAYGVRAY